MASVDEANNTICFGVGCTTLLTPSELCRSDTEFVCVEKRTQLSSRSQGMRFETLSVFNRPHSARHTARLENSYVYI